MLQTNYTSKAANSKKKRSDLWLPKVGVGEGSQKVQASRYKICKHQECNASGQLSLILHNPRECRAPGSSVLPSPPDCAHMHVHALVTLSKHLASCRPSPSAFRLPQAQGSPSESASLVAQWGRTRQPGQERRAQSLGQEDALEEEMAAHSSIRAWEVPRTAGPGGLQHVGLRERDVTWRLNTKGCRHFDQPGNKCAGMQAQHNRRSEHCCLSHTGAVQRGASQGCSRQELFSSLIFCLYRMARSLNSLRSSFHDLCQSSHVLHTLNVNNSVPQSYLNKTWKKNRTKWSLIAKTANHPLSLLPVLLLLQQ